MRAVAATLALLALAGCGAERTPVADPGRPAEVFRRDTSDFARAGLRFQLPVGWQRQEGPAPLVAVSSSGPVSVAVWRYPRAEPLPQDDLALSGARRSLLAAARARDPTLEVTSSEVTTVAGRPAVAVRATGEVDGRRRELRSTHLYAFGAEVVIDGYAPKRDLAVLERDVLGPLLASLRVREP